jgi:hypothetical protein
MPDLKKVIKGLEICTSRPCYCTDCPYKKECCLDSQNVMEDALALLKDKKAVKPLAIKKEMFNEYYGAVACCPKCDCMWIMYVDNDMHYCPECGQEVKWDE